MSETIVFFGSGPVAAASLALLAKDFAIEAVVTKPQPKHHKQRFPVLATTEELGLKVLSTADKTELSQLFKDKPVNSRLGVVIDYGIIIPPAVIDHFPLGIVNSHFSLLPRWRGADPISFAILEGDAQTGVSLMLIVDKLDEGPLLAQRSLPIEPDDTTPSLTAKLIDLSHQLLKSSLPEYATGNLQPQAQSNQSTSYSRKLAKQDSWLDFGKPAARLEREIRAFIEWPRSRAKINNIDVIMTAAHVVNGQGKPGQIWQDGKRFGFYTSENILAIDKLIPAGKKEMDSAAFLAGYQIN